MIEPVHVLVPVYNGLPYLHEAVASVFAQTVPEWRLHLVDDGSTDGSREQLLQYADPRVEITFNDRNLGLYGSLMRAIRRLPPGWIVVLMQDDRLKPTYLEELQAVRAAHPQGRAFWPASDTINAAGRQVACGQDSKRIEVIEPGPSAWLGGLQRGCFWIISGSCTHRDLLLELPFVPHYPHCADYDWLLRALLCTRLVYYERPLIELRVHPGQASTRHRKRGQDVTEALAILRDNFREHANLLDRSTVTAVCWRRLRLTLRRAAVALLRGQGRHAALMFGLARQFLMLPWVYARQPVAEPVAVGEVVSEKRS